MLGILIVEGMVMNNSLSESEMLRQKNMESEANIHQQLDQIIKLIQEVNEKLRGINEQD